MTGCTSAMCRLRNGTAGLPKNWKIISSVKVTYQEKFDFTSSMSLDNEDWIKKNISWPGIIRLSGKRTIFMGQNLEILLSTAWLMHNKFGLGSWLGCVWCFIVSPDNGAASFMESHLIFLELRNNRFEDSPDWFNQKRTHKKFIETMYVSHLYRTYT